MKTHVPSAKSSPQPLADRVAWYGIVALVALLPVTVAFATGPAGGMVSLTDDPYHVPKLLLAAVLLTISTAAWVFSSFAQSRPFRSDRAFIALSMFAALVVLSTIFGIEPIGSLFGGSGLMTGAVTWLLFAWMCVLIGQLLTSSTRLIELSWAFVGGGTVVALLALLQSRGVNVLGTQYTAESLYMLLQGSSTTGNPNYTGLLLLTPAVIAGGLAIGADRSVHRAIAASCGVAMALATFITLTRAAWIGLAVAAIIFVWMALGGEKLDRRKLLIFAGAAAGVVLVGALLAGPSLVVSRLASVTRGLDAFSTGRASLWSDTARVIADRPLLGTGADRLAMGAYDVQSNVVTSGISRFVLQDPHSLPLLIAGSFGVLALIAFAAFAGMALFRGWKLARTDGARTEYRVVYAAWVAGATGLLVASLISVVTITGVFSVFLILGVVLAPGLRPVHERSWVPVTVSVIGIVVVVTALFGAVQGFRSSRHVMQSRSGDSQFHLEEAMRISPWDTRMRVSYMWRKAGSFKPVITGSDIAAAQEALAALDTEIRLEILRSPNELLFYRMRVELYRLAQGFPAYDPQKVLDAIEDALVAYPNDEEFLRWRGEAQQELGS